MIGPRGDAPEQDQEAAAAGDVRAQVRVGTTIQQRLASSAAAESAGLYEV